MTTKIIEVLNRELSPRCPLASKYRVAYLLRISYNNAMSNASVEAKPQIRGNAIPAEPNSQAIDIMPIIYDGFEVASLANLSSEPNIPGNWEEKTYRLLRSNYQKASLIAQRAVHFFGHLGDKFPECAALEAMTRQVLVAGNLIPEKVIETVNHFQKRSRRSGSTMIYEFNSPMVTPAFLLLYSEFPKDEQEAWKKFAEIVPPLLVASIKFSQNKKIRDIPAVWNGVGKELRTKDEYERFVDEPVRAAVKHLNNLGIRTDASTANIEDAKVGSGAGIRLNDYALSQENLQTAKDLGLRNVGGYIWIDMDIKPDDDVSDVSREMLKKAKKFKKQV